MATEDGTVSPVKAVILSAGQGRRLLPLTADTPKCALPVAGYPLIEWQLDQLAYCGIESVSVVVGFGADHVERILQNRTHPKDRSTRYNPFYAMADNLVSCWVAAPDMAQDFLLLNGDTLFEAAVLERLLASPSRPITLATDHKPSYDADDMKVPLNADPLVHIGKMIPPEQTDGESIGMLLFRGEGPTLFRNAIEQTLRHPQALKQWYLSVIDGMASSGLVGICSIQGLQWAEVDCQDDLNHAASLVKAWEHPEA